MTPPSALAALRAALPGWSVSWCSASGEYAARRGAYSVHGRSVGAVVDAAAGLADARVRALVVRLPLDAALGGAVGAWEVER